MLWLAGRESPNAPRGCDPLQCVHSTAPLGGQLGRGTEETSPLKPIPGAAANCCRYSQSAALRRFFIACVLQKREQTRGDNRGHGVFVGVAVIRAGGVRGCDRGGWG